MTTSPSFWLEIAEHSHQEWQVLRFYSETDEGLSSAYVLVIDLISPQLASFSPWLGQRALLWIKEKEEGSSFPGFILKLKRWMEPSKKNRVRLYLGNPMRFLDLGSKNRYWPSQSWKQRAEQLLSSYPEWSLCLHGPDIQLKETYQWGQTDFCFLSEQLASIGVWVGFERRGFGRLHMGDAGFWSSYADCEIKTIPSSDIKKISRDSAGLTLMSCHLELRIRVGDRMRFKGEIFLAKRCHHYGEQNQKSTYRQWIEWVPRTYLVSKIPEKRSPGYFRRATLVNSDPPHIGLLGVSGNKGFSRAAHREWGFQSAFPLSKESEILLGFLEGKLTEPVVLGQLTNEHAQSPVTKHNDQEACIRTPKGAECIWKPDRWHFRTSRGGSEWSWSDRLFHWSAPKGSILMRAGHKLLHTAERWNMQSQVTFLTAEKNISFESETLLMKAKQSLRIRTEGRMSWTSRGKIEVEANTSIEEKTHRAVFKAPRGSITIDASLLTLSATSLECDAPLIECRAGTSSLLITQEGTVLLRAPRIVLEGVQVVI